MKALRPALAQLRSRSEREGGYLIVEFAIASTVLLVALSSLAVLSAGTSYLLDNSKQEQAASFLVNQTIEQIRALPYQTVANGLSSSDPTVATDSRISVSGSAPNETFTFLPTGEAMPHGTLSYTQAPLTPHQTITSVNGTSYTVSVYPSIVVGSSGVYRVTAIVTWIAPGTTNSMTVSAQTLVYSPGSGCLSNVTHPFAAPCQASFYGTVNTGNGSVSVAPVAGYTGNAIEGIALNSAQLALPQTGSTAQVEQTSQILGSSATSGGTLNVQGQGLQTTGQISASSSAGNDPASGAPGSSSSTVSQQSTILSYSNGNSISVTPTQNDSGTTASNVKAGTGSSCPDLSGINQSNALPCASSAIAQSSTTMTIASTISAGSTSLGTLTLAGVASPANPSNTFVTRSTGAPSTYCSGTSGDGCVHAAARRNVGNLSLAGLPANIVANAPAGWGNASCNNTNALVQVNGFSDSVVAESGNGSSNPTATQSSGTLVYWNGNGCTSASINWGANPGTVTIPAVNVSVPGIDHGVTVTMSATVALGATSTALTTPNGCTTACTASATSNSPVTVTITYTITDGADTLANLSISENLGSLSASTSYQAAP